MHPLIVFALLGSTLAIPQGYVFPTPSIPNLPVGPPNGRYQTPQQFSTRGSGNFNGPPGFPSSGLGGEYQAPNLGPVDSNDDQPGCPEGQVNNVDGTCAQPEVTRAIFVYDAPQNPINDVPTPEAPQPKIHYDIVFVRTAEDQRDQGPIVVPPPQQKTLVYVLNKDSENSAQQVIEVPAPQHQPEVFYINFKEGDNPQLPIGVDLESALSSVAAQQGQVIAGGGQEEGFKGGLSFGGAASFGNGGFIAGGRQSDGFFGGNQPQTSYQAPSNFYGSPRGK